jgi:hypothetical protein
LPAPAIEGTNAEAVAAKETRAKKLAVTNFMLDSCQMLKCIYRY